jgi:hypothetical protein
LRSFFLHLLGMDEHFQGGWPVKHGGPSRFTIWVAAFKYMKLSQFLQGIELSVNFQFFLLFVGFTIWLFVVYTIRQQDSLEGQMLNTYLHKGLSLSQNVDRQLVSHMRGAIPLQTTSNAGSLFFPSSAPKNNTLPAPAQQTTLSSPASASQTTSEATPTTSEAINDGFYTSSTNPGAAEASPSETAVDPRFGRPDSRFHSAQISSSNTNLATPLFPTTSPNTTATALDQRKTLNPPINPTTMADASVGMGLCRSATISRTNNDGRLRVCVDR